MNQRCRWLLPIFFVSFFLTAFFPQPVMAGFGITPPYVSNTSLTRNATYEQQILLVRSKPDTAQIAEITVDAPEIQDWIEVVEGDELLLPAGEQKIPMTVRVQVPADAEFKDYEGKIRIRTLPADKEVAAGAVSISLGALVDIDLTIIDRKIFDFRVRQISVPDLNEGAKVGWLYFPGKIRFNIKMENTGNVPVAPTQVEMRIYDRTGRALLEETTHKNRITKVDPYQTETVTAELPTRLPAGTYIARYRILNDDEVKQEGDLTLNILPAGTLQLGGYGFLGLSLPHKISLLLPIFAIIIAALYFWRARRRSKGDSIV